MTWAYAITFILLIPIRVLAETIPVVAGEHAGFTRVVLTLPQGLDWSTKKSDTSFSVLLPPTNSFDISRVFDKIPRTRISTIQTNSAGNQLEVKLSCRCTSEAFLYRDIYLVVDFRGSEDEGTQLVLIPNNQRQFDAQSLLPPWWTEASSMESSTQISGNNPETMMIQSEISTNLLFERLTQDVATAKANSRIDIDQTRVDRDELSIPINRNQSEIQVDPYIGLEIRYASPLKPLSDEIPTSCETFGSEQMFSGISSQQPYRDISQLRQELFSDTGQENETIVIQLAIAQLKFGMTAEARLLLRDLHNSTRQTRLLTKISQIIDQSLAVQDDMKQYQNCNNSLYFWYFLTARSGSLDSIDSSGILLQFKSISPWLQKVIFLQLYSKLKIDGESSAADEIEAHISLSQGERENGRFTPQTYVFQGNDPDINHAIGAANRDRPDLVAKVLASPKTSGEAEKLILLSQAIRFEHQETPIWNTTLESEILVNLSVNNYAAAVIGLEELVDSGKSSGRIIELSNQIILKITLSANDTDFLAAYFRMDLSVLSNITIEAVNTRLKSLEMPEMPLDLGETTIDQANEEPGGITPPLTLPSELPTDENRAALSRGNVRDALDESQQLKAEIFELTN